MKNTNYPTKNTIQINAFTLVELSIVLVIIGLLTAGVVGGQSLIESAKQRSFISELRGYEQATLAFKLEYDALPGDMKDATSYWTAKSSCSFGGSMTATTTTCNGDGDGKIFVNMTTFNYEMYMAFNHLALAGLIPGGYSGTTIPNATPGITSPALKSYKNTLLLLEHIPLYGIEGHKIINWSLNGTSNTGLFAPKTAKSIDLKADDGRAYSGKFLAGQYIESSTDSPCVTGNVQLQMTATATTADYVLTTTKTTCDVSMQMSF